MNNRPLVAGIAAAAAIVIAILIYTWVSVIQQHAEVQPPPVPTSTSPPFELKPAKGLPKVILLDVGKIQTFVSNTIAHVDIPVKVISIAEVRRDGDAASKRETVLSSIALPILHGRTYSGIASLNARCTPPEPCKTRSWRRASSAGPSR